MQTSTTHDEGLHDTEFVVMSYNIHYHMRFEERVHRLLAELGDKPWDVIAVQETWGDDSREEWMDEGHHWLGSGGSARSKGVGFLVHSRWRGFTLKHIS